MVPDLVAAEDLGSALAMSSLTFNLARAVGPVLGAVVVARWGVALAFGLNSLSYLGLIAGLLAVRPVQARRPAGPTIRWRDSLRLVLGDPAMLGLLGVVAAISFSQDPVSTLTPGFSSEIFHRADTLAGLLVGAFGAGSALAAVTVAGRFRDPLRRLPVGCLCMGLAMVGFGLAPTLPVAFAALAAGGFCFMATNTAATTALMREAVPEQRGRVMALWSLCFLGTRPLASLGDGAVASTAGLRVAAVALTAPVLIAAAATSRLHARTDPGARPSGVKEIP
jgi:predicted MFS family arabinose efflux permease